MANSALPSNALATYMNELANVYKYRLNNEFQTHSNMADIISSVLNRSPNSWGFGGPSAQTLAMEAMRAQTPDLGVGNISPRNTQPQGKSWVDSLPWWVPPIVTTPLHNLDAAVNSGPGKAVLDIISRPMYGVGSAMQAELDNPNRQTAVGVNPSNFLNPFGDVGHLASAFWKGLSGQNKVTPGQALFYDQRSPASTLPTPVKGVGGFVADVGFDPTSYIPFGAISKLAKGGKATATAAEVPTVADKVLSQVPRQSWALTPEELAAKVSPSDIPVPPDIVAPSTKAVVPTVAKVVPLSPATHTAPPGFSWTLGAGGKWELVPSPTTPFATKVAANVQAQALTDVIGQTPKLAHPGLNVSDLWPAKEVTAATSAAPTVNVQASKLAQLRAIKMALMQAPDYKVQGKWAMSDLLRTAGQDPSAQKNIEQLINNEAKKLYQNPDLQQQMLPLSGKGYKPIIRMTTKEGKPVPFGLTLEQATNLLKSGEVGAGGLNYSEPAVQQFLKHLPIHDPTDLENVFLNNAKGETVSLGQYMRDLGIKVKAVSPADTGAANSVFQFVRDRAAAAIPTERTKLTGADAVTWALQHQGTLSKQELTYLRQAKTAAEFDKRVAELSTKTVAGDFKTIQDLVAAHEAGLLPDKAWREVLKASGAKDSKELLSRAEKIFQETGAAKPAETLAAPFGESVKPTAGKLERFRGPAPASPWDGVKPVDAVISDVAAGNLADITPTLPPLSKTLIEDVSAGLNKSVIWNLVSPQDLQKYGYETLRGTKRTSPVLRQGLGRNLKGWNAMAQMTTFKNITAKVSKDLATTGLTGKELSRYLAQRPSLMYQRVMDAMNFADAALKAKGVRIISGLGESGTLLSLMDVLNSLEPAVVKRFLFTRGKNSYNVFSNRILEAADNYVQAALHGGSMDLAHEANLNKVFADLKPAERLDGKGAVALDKAIRDSLPKILQRVNINYATESIKYGQAVKSMNDAVIQKLILQFNDPASSIGDFLGEIADRAQNMSKVARDLNAPAGAVEAGKVVGNSELASAGVDPQSLVEGDAAKRFASAPAVADNVSRKTGVAQQSQRAISVGRTPAEELDLGELNAARLNAGIFKANAPVTDKVFALQDILGRAFYAPYGHADLHDMVHINHNVTQAFSRMHRGIMQITAQKAQRLAASSGRSSDQILQEAFKQLQTGTPVADAAMQDIIDTMGKSIDILFSGGRSGTGAYAVRNGLFADHLNNIMRRYGISAKYQFAETVPLISQKDSWKAWQDVKDPLDLLDRIHAAYQRATVDVTIGRDISSAAHEWVSSVPKPGFVKITDKRGISSVFRFMDHELYYAQDIVKQIPYLDKFLTNSVFRSGGLLKMYDQLLHMWKSSVTIYRPGHHIRNFIGDTGLSFLSGVTDPRAYLKGMQVLATRGSVYKDMDVFKALMAGEQVGLKSAKYIVVKAGGKNIQVSFDHIWRAAFNQGLLPDYHILEDIAFTDSQKFTSIGGVKLAKPLGGRGQAAAGGLSQARDHWVRLTHFVDALEKSSAKTLDEAFQEAGHTVRKWHPDGSDLTAFERQVMRRIIPFYSWFRKAIPLVVESYAMHPGRVMVVPKASYNLALAMGLDPNSLGDPFPQNTLFPQWLQDNMLGPQWQSGTNLYGINPGDPVTDLGSSFLGAQAGNQVLGGVTPALKVPIELMSAAPGNYAKTLGTGSDVHTASEYWNQTLPGLGYVANITGTNPLAGFTPSRNVQRGYQEPGMDVTALVNFLTGLGVKNYTKPQYQKAAQFELRDELRRASQGG